MKLQDLDNIMLLYNFMAKVGCLPQMFTEFNNSIYNAGKEIVGQFCDPSSELAPNEEAKQSQDVEMADDSQQKVQNKKRNDCTKLIAYLIVFRVKIQKILDRMTEDCESRDHSGAFKREEKAAFQKICELCPEMIPEYMAKFMHECLVKSNKPSPAIKICQQIYEKDPLEDEQVEDLLLNKTIDLFKCIKFTDIFEGFYRQELSFRLLYK